MENKTNRTTESERELEAKIQAILEQGEEMDALELERLLDQWQRQDPVMEDYDPAEQWNRLRENNPMLFSDSQPRKKALRLPKRRLRRTIKGMAAAFLALLTCANLWLALDVDARNNFQSWVREQARGAYVYRFAVGDPLNSIPDYELTGLPGGGRLERRLGSDDILIKLYSYQDEGQERMALLTCRRLDNDTVVTVPTEDRGYFYIREAVSMDGAPADFFYERTGRRPNELMWLDGSSGVVFFLSAFADREELIELAKSVSVSGR